MKLFSVISIQFSFYSQKITISFNITPNVLKLYNYDLKYDWELGEFNIMIGGNSREVKSGKVN